MDKLLPCPFCGSNVVSIHYNCSKHHETTYGAGCQNCQTKIYGGLKTKEIAALRWNTRAQPTPTSNAGDVKLREALETAIHHLKSVERDTYYQFDSDFTPEEERLIPRLEKVLKSLSEWVCETHTDKAFPDECSCSAGMLRKDAEKHCTSTAESDLAKAREVIAELVKSVDDCLANTAERAALDMDCTTTIDEEDGTVCYPWGNGVNISLNAALQSARAFMANNKESEDGNN